MLRLASDDARQSSHRPRPNDERRVTAAVRFMECTAHDPDDPRLSLGALAQQAGMSRYHFLRTFRSLVGLAPYQYLLRLRMQRAAVDLRATNETVTEVALRAGFNDLSAFSRRFRRLMGTSPAAYRKGAGSYFLASGDPSVSSYQSRIRCHMSRMFAGEL